ncbi:MAG: phosphocarrier protein HPr [Gammaproteobacteria bacterium RIFCSPLOWO2_02_FULL_61_13]|nr:MAG: phosphocarrier protein HPr [Gammaproteobacteria bacterium RIFCSPLOWO2_02_FULL_61_13]
MPQRSMVLVNKLGLHARAAASFVKTAAAFGCDITVNCNGKDVNGKSIMGVMMLAAAKGSAIEVTADGPGAAAALDRIEALVLDRFGEDE